MTVLKRRNRMVNFRLSEDEYKDLKDLCVSEGARSISDYARAAVCKSLNGRAPESDHPLDERMRRLDGKVEELDRAIRLIVELVGNGNGWRKESRKRVDAPEVSS